MDKVREAIEMWLVTIEAHCMVLKDPDENDDLNEIVNCIEANCDEIRTILKSLNDGWVKCSERLPGHYAQIEFKLKTGEVLRGVFSLNSVQDVSKGSWRWAITFRGYTTSGVFIDQDVEEWRELPPLPEESDD